MNNNFEDNSTIYGPYTDKMPSPWLSRQITDIYRLDPSNYPYQDTGLYHNYDTLYQDNFNPQNNSWVEEYLEQYEEIEYYIPQNYQSDEGDWDEDYNY